jgi:hypothetical protein
MQAKTYIVFAFLLLQVSIFAQTNFKTVPAPVENSFAPILSFLSSDWMEGREAGSKGSFMAADYVASMMQLHGLKPYGDIARSNEKGTSRQSYFQDFEILQYRTDRAELAFIQRTPNSHTDIQLLENIDFTVSAGVNSSEGEAAIIFAGYGICAANKGYDDYAGIDVKGKIVLIFEGFPGHTDTTSTAWKKFGKAFGADDISIDSKIQTARKHGAVAIMIVDSNGKFEPFKNKQTNQALLSSTMNSEKNTDLAYEEYYHTLPNDTANALIPYFKLGSAAGEQLLAGTGLKPADFEKKTARTAAPSSILLKDKVIRFSVSVKTEALLVRNVLGMIRGKDSTRNIILGGHYDHLGTHNGQIYNGSDDNASGTSGLLALAKTWVESGIKPACNLIFAAWTAEESGLLGSQYFVQQFEKQPKNILLYINMDMISRSVTEDTARRQLSIGTRTTDENLRELARKSNSKLQHPFEFDLWDVTGHSGSDYASFTAENIPIMTYNTGLHDDYHTPRDISVNADLKKMGDVLQIVNTSLQEILETISGK